MENDKFVLDFISNENNFYLANEKTSEIEESKSLDLRHFTIYHIEEITFEEKAPRKEAFENVISALRIDGVSFLYLIIGKKTGVSFYFGVVKNLSERKKDSFEISEIGEKILEASIKGNFRGSKIEEVSRLDKQKILEEVRNMPFYGMIEGVPGINEESEDIQGVDRLIDVMMGEEYGVAIISHPLNSNEIYELEKNLYSAYNGIAPFIKETIQDGISSNESSTNNTSTNKSDTTGESYSKTTSKSTANNTGESEGKNKSTSKGHNNSSGDTSSGTDGSSSTKTWGTTKTDGESKSDSTNKSTTIGCSAGESKTFGKSNSSSKTIEFVNKEAQEWLKYLDEVIIPRLDYGKGKGIFLTTSFVFANNKNDIKKLGNTMMSLYSGKTGNKVSLKMEVLEENDRRIEFFKNFQIPYLKINHLPKNELDARSALSQYISKNIWYLGNWMSTNELSLMAGLPQKEVIGMSLREEVEFGLNFKSEIIDENKMILGNIVQSGRILDKIDVCLDKDNLNKHTFVTGVTGSGKTTTCQKILMDSKFPFMVIEPAKTEYRSLTESFDDILVFTLGKNTLAPFRLNPFEFFEHESITSRVDMLKASMEAAFDMEAAIPQILETAMYEIYMDYGWNIASNKNEKYKDPFADGVYAFPTLEDLVMKIEKVVKKQGFDERLKNDYIGSIKARLQGLTVGSKGMILNTKRSIDFRKLVKRKVVLELEEIRSGSEKSLIMGFILTNLVEALKAVYYKEGKFNHLTLIEEAHRLLSRYESGDSLNKKQGVEVFTDMLAEVRKYGEGLIIVDQIPNKLTPEILKNTNTKIVHKIFAKDDKEAIGNTIALNDEQKNFLSNLETGRAIVFTQGWNKALQIQIKKHSSINNDEITDEEKIRKNALNFYRENYKRGILLGLQNLENEPDFDFMEKYMKFIQDERISDKYRNSIETNKSEKHKELLDTLIGYTEDFDKEFISGYLVDKFYIEEAGGSREERKENILKYFRAIETGEKGAFNKYNDELQIRRN